MVEQVCRCGRSGIHCAFCGKKNFYSLSSESYSVKGVNDTVVEVMKYRCRTCGKTFDDLERSCCIATSRPSRKTAKAIAVLQSAPDTLQEAAKGAAIAAQRFLASRSNEANTPKTKPFEIGDDREIIQQAISDSGAILEEAKASVLLHKGDGEIQIVESTTEEKT